MAALTTVVVAAAATAVAGAVAGAGAATGTSVGAAPVLQPVNGGGPGASRVAVMGPRELQAPEAGPGSRALLNRCPLPCSPRGWRRGACLPVLQAWHTPGVLSFVGLYRRLTAFTEPAPCGFGVEKSGVETLALPPPFRAIGT